MKYQCIFFSLNNVLLFSVWDQFPFDVHGRWNWHAIVVDFIQPRSNQVEYPMCCYKAVPSPHLILIKFLIPLTCWWRDKIATILKTTFSNAFSLMKMYEFNLIFHWSLVLMLELTIFQHWFIKWLGADQATSHNLNQWWLVYWHIYTSFSLNELSCHLNDTLEYLNL